MSKLLYQGSVKNVYQVDFDHLEFEFTDQYSVFDWGRMPDLIKGKGKALTDITESVFLKLQNPNEWKKLETSETFKKTIAQTIDHYSKSESEFFKLFNNVLNDLKKSGLKTHFVKRTSDQKILVKKVEVHRPVEKMVNGQSQYEYPKVTDAHFIPLEIVFRFGVTKGSSYLKRVNIPEDSYFGFPILEMFSKLEPQDRFLNEQEAFVISSLSKEEFQKLKITKMLTVIFLKEIIEKSGLVLIDGKTEWAIDANRNFVLVDSIGPDELRILDSSKILQLSKEFLRNYYRNSKWYKTITTEKEIGGDWKSRVKKLNIQPTNLSPQYLKTTENLFITLANIITSNNASNLPTLLNEMKKCVQTKKMNVAVLGSGGREHALASKISESNLTNEVFVIPGNDGIAEQFTCMNWDQKDFNILKNIINDNKIDFVIVGPDQLLSDGVVDYLSESKIKTFGPTKQAAKLEWSKLFAKKIMTQAQVPTAKYIEIKNELELHTVADSLSGYPYVLKYDGLALGKGVCVCNSLQEAKDFYESIVSKYGKDASIFAEQFSKGQEVSLFALCNGSEYVLFEPACDHKRLNDQNLGPNTGGMGAFSPVPWFSFDKATLFGEKIFPNILKTMQENGTPFRGLLFAGLMVYNDTFEVLEFNARFGDPETQCLLPRLDCDLLEYLVWSVDSDKSLKEINKQNPWKFFGNACVNVVATASGYPENVQKGDEIFIQNLNDNSKIFFSGVTKKLNHWYTNGGRVLSISALSKDLNSARELAYTEIRKIEFKNIHYRKDIANMRSYQ